MISSTKVARKPTAHQRGWRTARGMIAALPISHGQGALGLLQTAHARCGLAAQGVTALIDLLQPGLHLAAGGAETAGGGPGHVQKGGLHLLHHRGQELILGAGLGVAPVVQAIQAPGPVGVHHQIEEFPHLFLVAGVDQFPVRGLVGAQFGRRWPGPK